MKQVEQILLKAPFKRAIPISDWSGMLSTGVDTSVPSPMNMYTAISQDKFLSEYDPAGHRINDEHYYANRLKTDDNGNTYIHFVERVSLPFQAVITTKQMTHLSGNPIRFVDANPNPSAEQKKLLMEYKQGWISKNMEVAMHDCFEMEKITGDSALCGYLDNGVFGWRIFGYRNGEVLYPHYDPRTGKLSQFGRRYDQVGDDGKTQNMLDVWDDTSVATYRRDTSTMGKIKKIIGQTGWIEESNIAHGFDSIPIAYKRSEMGACWSLAQDCIDKYEIAVSQLCENNKAYAFRIMFVKGEDISVGSVDSSGQPSVITGDKDSDAKFLEKADASSSFDLQLKILLQNIFLSSFVVIPPEVKGGDLPGVTIKILYSPAVEKAMEDAMHWNSFVDDVVRIFKFGLGVEEKKSAQFNTLKVRGEIIPYVHQNDQEIINNLNSSVTMGTLSTETAASKHPYASSDEFTLIEQDVAKEQEIQITNKLQNQTNAARQTAAQ